MFYIFSRQDMIRFSTPLTDLKGSMLLGTMTLEVNGVISSQNKKH